MKIIFKNKEKNKFMKFNSPEEEKEYFKMPLENRKKIKGDVTFQPPQVL